MYKYILEKEDFFMYLNSLKMHNKSGHKRTVSYPV